MKLKIMYAPADATGNGQAINSQDQAAAKEKLQGQIQSRLVGPETRRELPQASYSGTAGVIPVEIPRDTCVKRIDLEAIIGLTATYAAGSPVYSPQGLFSRLCPVISIVINGSRYVKTIQPFMYRVLCAYAFGGFARRAYQTGAGILSSTREPQTEWLSGTVAYPATTQDTVYNESLSIYFENMFAYGRGADVTQLYTAGASSCWMYFNFVAASNVLNDGNAASVTYSNVSCIVTPTIIENRQGTPANNAFDLVETMSDVQISAQVSNRAIDLNTGNKLLGLGIMVQNGDTAKTLSDTAVTKLNLKVNGSQDLALVNFKNLRNDNKNRYGVSDDQYASGTSAAKGVAWLNLMKDGDILSGISTRREDGVSQLQLYIDSASSSGVDPATYTNPVNIKIMQQQLVPVPLGQ